jgi:hypothetical protein
MNGDLRWKMCLELVGKVEEKGHWALGQGRFIEAAHVEEAFFACWAHGAEKRGREVWPLALRSKHVVVDHLRQRSKRLDGAGRRQASPAKRFNASVYGSARNMTIFLGLILLPLTPRQLIHIPSNKGRATYSYEFKSKPTARL